MKKIMNNFKEYDELIHISHTDLDGFSAQFLTKQLLDKNIVKHIEYFNMDYNDEKKCINEVISYILNDKTKTYFVLITDIGLTVDGIKKLNNFLKGNKNIKIQLQLIDHHKSGKEFNDTVEWYYFNNDYCATKLLYLNCIEPLLGKDINLAKFVDIVNAYDVWNQEENIIYFYLGVNLSETIMNSIKYPIEFNIYYKRIHIMKYFEHILDFYNLNRNVKIIQENFYNIQNQILFELSNNNEYFLNSYISYEYKFHYYCALIYKETFQSSTLFKVDDYEFKLVSLDSNLFQNMSHFLMDDKDNKCQMIINIKSDGKVSLRSVGKIYDVSKFAIKYFNGGGHFNAAGGGEKLEIKPFFDQTSLEKSFKEYLLNYQN